VGVVWGCVWVLFEVCGWMMDVCFWVFVGVFGDEREWGGWRRGRGMLVISFDMLGGGGSGFKGLFVFF